MQKDVNCINKKYSIKDISVMRKDRDETLLFCQFLDDFYSEKSADGKYQLIKEEPVYDESSCVFMCMLACAVHKLANDYNLETPKWVFNEKYVLKDIHYAFDTKDREYQEFLQKNTPDEYKCRNLYYGEDVLKRC